jgi:type I restriction enzyme, S subunit
MRVGGVSFQDVIAEGTRLTGAFHLSEDQLAVATVRRARTPTEPLHKLVRDRGIFRGPIFSRRYVAGPEYGEPYVSAKDLMAADVQPSAYLSRSHGKLLDTLRLREGMILVTCSGMNLGKAIWTRPELDGIVASHDLIRICPDSSAAPPGYLYAFLAGRYGHALIRKQIYGGHIKHIEPRHLANLPVPRLSEEVEARAHELVEKAARLRSEASTTLGEVKAEVEQEIGAPSVEKFNKTTHDAESHIGISDIDASRRLDAFYYNKTAVDIERWVAGHTNGHWRLGEVAKVFDVPPFKHIYVSKDRGVPFYTSGDLFRLERLANKYLSRTRTKNINKYAIMSGWVLLARSGQLGGIIGRAQFADSLLDDTLTSDHIIRIVPMDDLVPPGYLYAYLSTTSVGYTLLTRTMTGASVPALWPKYLNTVCIVKASMSFMKRVDSLVRQAFEQRVAAINFESVARTIVEHAIEAAT